MGERAQCKSCNAHKSRPVSSRSKPGVCIRCNGSRKPRQRICEDCRFASRVAKADGDACWLWTGRTDENGYGRYSPPTGEALAHRVAWEREHGPIPDGLFALHKCDNPPCVRPSHLFLGTQADNIADMMAKGRRYWRHAQARAS